MASSWLALLLTLVCTLWSSRLWAEPTAAERDTARNSMKLGDEHLEAGRYAEALVAFEGADAIMGVPSTRLAVGVALEKLGRLVEARDKLLSVGRIPTADDEDDVLKKARKDAEVLAYDVGQRIPSLRVVVQGVDDGAAITLEIDGRTIPAEAAALPQKLDPGEHQVAVVADGYEPIAATVTLVEREAKEHTVVLQRRQPDSVAPSPIPVPAPPAPPPPLPETPPDPVPPPQELIAVMIVGIVVGGTGLLVGIGTGAAALVSAKDLDCPDDVCPIEQQDAFDRTVALSHAATVGFAVAGAGAVVALVGMIVALEERENESSTSAGGGLPTAALHITPGGLSLHGTF